MNNYKNQDIQTNTEKSTLSIEYFSSEKCYIEYPNKPIKVPFRKIKQTDTNINGNISKNPDIFIYDTSSEYSLDTPVDIEKGLNRHRIEWLKESQDIDQLEKFSSEYTNSQFKEERLNFKNRHIPFKAKEGTNVSQMHYARKGII